MLHQHIQDPTLVHRTELTGLRGDPAVLAIRRAEQPPTEWRPATRRKLRFWGYLAAAAILAALLPVTAAFGVNIADSTATRVLVAFALPVVAGVAVTTSAAAADAVPKMSRRKRRTRC